MDLGCGPGTLTIPFAKIGMRVTAIDPEPDMLDWAREAARQAAVEVVFHQASSFALPPDIGPFKLVTMGRAFHWMDRAGVLNLLDGLVSNDGALAFFDDDHPKTVENGWQDILRAVAERYGRADATHIKDRQSESYRRHESDLLELPFSLLDGLSVFVKREITADEIVGRAFSLSTSSPEKLGDRAAAFELELRGALADFSPSGRFAEIAKINALLARRP